MSGESRRRTVLVVDDQPTNVRLLADILRPRHDVVFATTGARALAIAASRDVDLVLLDVHLPDMHGYEVCRALLRAERTARVPVVFVTGSDSPDNEQARRDAGAAETILKPFDIAHLLARVDALLDR